MRRGKPMKYWGFYASEELKAETIRCAIAANEDNSEYIRKAVEQRNTQYEHSKPLGKPFDFTGLETLRLIEEDKARTEKIRAKNDTVSKPDDFTEEEQRIINEVKKNTPQKSKMVQSFMKGGK
jgi:hypothetical protein